MDLTPQQELHGFTVRSREPLPEIDGIAYMLTHEKSGSKLLYLQNDDNNKAFSIAFKTPPENDTGVFHILEHSVLCGSRKFPVKEPFVNLLKSSMQTFLNAMTFPDKTMYPVASTNDKDLRNLMDVYLDAVFHPNIYRKRAIFEQEGWHYELADDNAETPEQGAGESGLALNGVVYNEMKGALSDPNSVLYDELQTALFPDNAYRFESGGTPRAIPTLTYEHYLEEHERHYRTDNSYITLYGNLDVDEALRFLDEQYLTPVAAEQQAAREARAAQGLALLTPHPLRIQQPVVRTGVVRRMATAPENACMGLGYVVGTAQERTRIVAADILMDAIMGSNEAPLKRALLDAGLADDAQGFLADSLLQPFVVIQLRGLADGAQRRFSDVVRTTLEKLAAGGLDHTLVEASLSRAEFVMRERDFGVADGVALSMTALAGWLYDDSLATAYLRYEKDFATLREELPHGYFEDLIRTIFLESTHHAEVEVQPAPDEEPYEAERLSHVAATLDDEGRAHIAAEVAELRRLQEEPDRPEDVATLPRLTVSDIGDAPKEPAYGLVEGTTVPTIRHHIPTRGLAYAYRYFDLSHLPFSELPYVAVLGLVLGKLGTKEHSAAEIDTLTNGKLGNLTFFSEIYENETDPDALMPKFVVSASALSENIDWLVSLPIEIMLSTDFSDLGKIRDALQQRRIGMEQSFASNGHSSAMARLASYYLPAGVVREQLGGVDFYRFLKDLLAHFDERADDLRGHLQRLARQVFATSNIVVSFAGSDEDFARFTSLSTKLAGNAQKTAEGHLAIPAPTVKNEAFIVPTDVCYAAQGFDRRKWGAPYTGVWQVAARVLSFDYLWNEVRVKGGAYGAGFQAARTGTLRFYSFRDPHLDKTLARFQGAGAWLRNFRPTPQEMEGYVVATVAGFDTPLKTRMLMRRQDGDWFGDRTPEGRLATRREMVHATDADVRALHASVTAATKADAVCVFGNKDILEGSKAGLKVIDLMN